MKISTVAAAFKTLEKLDVPLTPAQVEACRDTLLREIGLSKEQMLRLLNPQKTDAPTQIEDAQRLLLISELHEMQNFLEQSGGKVGNASIAMGHDRQWISDTIPRLLQENPWIREIQSLQTLIQAVESNKKAKS